MGLLVPIPAPAEPIRLAYVASELGRDGPGLLLRDLIRGDAPDITAMVQALADVRPDVLGLSGIDHDLDGHAVAALQDLLRQAGLDLPHRFAGRPNSGMRTTLDLNGDGRVGDPQDAQGFGRFPGAGGLAILSALPIAGVRDLTDLLWRDVPWADPPKRGDGAAFPTPEVFARQRLPHLAHWHVSLGGEVPMTVILFSAASPVFDGPEDRNGRRNADELRLVAAHLEDGLSGPVMVMGTLNQDPADGQGRREALRGLLDHPRLIDPKPRSPEGRARSDRDGGINARHLGDPTEDTADFREDRDRDPGNLRVDYVLPDRALRVVASGVHWPTVGRRGIVWVDLELQVHP